MNEEKVKKELLNVLEAIQPVKIEDVQIEDENEVDTPLSKFPHTDRGAAEMFAFAQGEKLRFNHDTGSWLYFDGQRWSTQKGEPMARNLFIETARQLREEALL